MKKILIIAGGTGGHIFPALVVAEALQKKGVEVVWMGAEGGMEKKILGDRFPLYLLPIGGFRRKNIFIKLLIPFRIMRAMCVAFGMIRKIRPDVALAMGGYVSGPAGIAARLSYVPLVIHEQNTIAGLTNRILSHFATRVLEAFPDAFPNKKTVTITVGNPVRESILALAHAPGYYATRAKPFHVLVLGGSQGATVINKLISAWITLSPKSLQYRLWHQTGERDFAAIQKSYESCPGKIERVEPFITDIAQAYAWADMVICRSGAATVSEIAAAGIPALFIPYPNSVDNHQHLNAMFLESRNAAYILPQEELSIETLDHVLENFFGLIKELQHIADRAKMAGETQGAARVIEVCEAVARKSLNSSVEKR